METKLFELRDRMTFIPIIATRCTSLLTDEQYLLRRAGYSNNTQLILLTRLEGGKAFCNAYDWGDRTFQVAHEYITKHWPSLKTGDVIDVEYILGETGSPKQSEKFQ